MTFSRVEMRLFYTKIRWMAVFAEKLVVKQTGGGGHNNNKSFFLIFRMINKYVF